MNLLSKTNHYAYEKYRISSEIFFDKMELNNYYTNLQNCKPNMARQLRTKQLTELLIVTHYILHITYI